MSVELPPTVAENWKFFVNAQLWPRAAKFDPKGWLENFEKGDQKYAIRLLEGFTYFSSELVEALFCGAFQNLSQFVVQNKDNYFSASTQWNQFVESALVVRVEGHHSSDADSGFIFTRIARDIIGVQEEQILPPAKALERLREAPRGNVIFVDDFVGSGEQFENTWTKIHQLSDFATGSFKSLVATIGSHSVGFYYCPLICTEIGRKHISGACPLVKVVPAHILPDTYSALSDNSVIWRDDMRVTGPEFVERASNKARIPFRDGQEGCWKGYRKLGLALAFAHGWPDAILPIFTHQENGWKPLLKK
ncbi:MAG: phosphoribosyltransferase-like protein [Achromobacter pulmonis]